MSFGAFGEVVFERDEFFWGKCAGFARRKVAKFEGCHAYAYEFFDVESLACKEVAYDVFSAFVDDDDGGFAGGFKVAGFCDFSVDFYACEEVFDGCFVHGFVKGCDVFFGNAKAWVGECCCKVSVVGEQEESFGVFVKASDGVDSVVCFDELHDGFHVVFFANGCDVSRGFVEDEVSFLFKGDGFAVDSDVVFDWVCVLSKLGSFSVNGYFSCSDEFFAGASAGNSCCCHDLLDAFHVCSSIFLVNCRAAKGLLWVIFFSPCLARGEKGSPNDRAAKARNLNSALSSKVF